MRLMRLDKVPTCVCVCGTLITKHRLIIHSIYTNMREHQILIKQFVTLYDVLIETQHPNNNELTALREETYILFLLIIYSECFVLRGLSIITPLCKRNINYFMQSYE